MSLVDMEQPALGTTRPDWAAWEQNPEDAQARHAVILQRFQDWLLVHMCIHLEMLCITAFTLRIALASAGTGV